MVYIINMKVCWFSFDRFYMVTKFILPSTGDLNFSTFSTCAYLDSKKSVRSNDILQED